jgi:hypothetical protein
MSIIADSFYFQNSVFLQSFDFLFTR